MRDPKIKQMAYDAMFLAIIILMTFVPYLGYIQIGPISFTLVHIPVLIGSALFGWKRGLLYGLFFGLGSLIKATTLPGTIDFLFVNPLVSVLPRLIFGLASGGLFSLLRHFQKLLNKGIILLISSLLLTILHTFLVLSILWLIYRVELNVFLESEVKYIGFALGGLIGLGAIIEASVALVVVPSVVIPIMYKMNVPKKEISEEKQ